MPRSIPCMVMRGGTSKGLFFLGADLPKAPAERDRVLLAVMGSPHPRQIDGLGGADHLASKVAIVSPSHRPQVDVDYLFAQIGIAEARVDTSANCGNIVAGVAPFAIERGLVSPDDPETTVRIFNVNTSAVVKAIVHTPGGCVTYEGSARIDGIAGTAAPVKLGFTGIVGSKTGALFPSSWRKEAILGIDVTLVDIAVPMLFVDAGALGVTGYETKDELDQNGPLLSLIEEMRREAGWRLGLGDVRSINIPLATLVARPRCGGTIAARTFFPYTCHPAYGVTQTLATAACCLLEQTVPGAIANLHAQGKVTVVIEHPGGTVAADVEVIHQGGKAMIERVSMMRTCRKLLDGQVYTPRMA